MVKTKEKDPKQRKSGRYKPGSRKGKSSNGIAVLQKNNAGLKSQVNNSALTVLFENILCESAAAGSHSFIETKVEKLLDEKKELLDELARLKQQKTDVERELLLLKIRTPPKSFQA